jgi:hypothetical protein
MTKRALAVLAVAGACVSAASADVVVPNANTNVSSGGTGLNTFIRDINAPRSGQLLIDASQLGGISVGQPIFGLTFRMYNGNTTGFPPSAATWADYTINMGVGVPLGTQTTTFANNFVGAPTNVRSGPLTINPGTFPGGAPGGATSTIPNAFGQVIMFTNPYIYTGGNLLVEIRHTGSNITNPLNSFLDAIPTTAPGYGTAYWSATATTFAATTGAQATFTVTNLVTIPAPGAAAVLGLGGLLAARRRR